MRRKKKNKLKKAVAVAFATLIVAIFTGGAVDYLSQNSENLLALMLTSTEKAIPPDKPESAQATTPKPSKAHIAVEWKEQPVDFLEEILPEITPDPKRNSYPVEELDVSFGTKIENFCVSDTSDSGLDLAEEIKKELAFVTDDLSKPTVLLYHTHTCEGYLPNFSGFYYSDEPFRSTDLNKNVSIVAENIKESLEKQGIGVIHDKTIHDSPAFNGAYARSMDTVQGYLEKYNSIKVTIDVHRDSMSTDDGLSYKPTTTIDGKKAAQVMIIAGSDPTGELEFENWEEDLVFALKLQKKAADLYPGLMRPLMYCQRKYNMDATNASLIFEVGTEVNTYSEAKHSGKLMGNVLADVLKDNLR